MNTLELLYAESQDNPDDYRWEAADVIEHLRDELESAKIDFAETHQSNMAVERALEGTGYTGTYAECIEGLKREIAELRKKVNELEEDSNRLDFIEQKVLDSKTGVSFCYSKYAEDGLVLEKGFRMMWKSNLGYFSKDIRQAIDNSSKYD